jgi:hypothetical protein
MSPEDFGWQVAVVEMFGALLVALIGATRPQKMPSPEESRRIAEEKAHRQRRRAALQIVENCKNHLREHGLYEGCRVYCGETVGVLPVVRAELARYGWDFDHSAGYIYLKPLEKSEADLPIPANARPVEPAPR